MTFESNGSKAPLRTEAEALRYIRSPKAIRERCHTILNLGKEGRLPHFTVRIDTLARVVELVRAEIETNYPDLDVPFHSRWRHFDVGGIERLAALDEALSGCSPLERARSKIELAIVSVLLDAGAGSAWSFSEGKDRTFSRSEGLAVASLHAFNSGIFGAPYTVTARGLLAIGAAELGEAFQVSSSNPLVGLDGRVSLMNRLGQVIIDRPDIFGSNDPRLGGALDRIVEASRARGTLPAAELLSLVLEIFAPIWPGRLTLAGQNLGDVWRHSKMETNDCTNGLIPFHKLSQWLTYSLLEPLADGGVEVEGIDVLTGLAEYRNGGLFLDTGVLELRDPGASRRPHAPSSELIVEWRALTVALLDLVAEELRLVLNKTPDELPLAKVLQGGTWNVGRRLAAKLREGGVPPLAIESDGTVF